MRFFLKIFLPLLLLPSAAAYAQETVVSNPANSITARVQELESSSVVAKAPSVSVVGDTLVFSASAYRLAEDASLEDLLNKIPGIEVSGNNVTLHGRKIEELRINGRRYFGGEVAVGLQNIPADMIDKIGAYERESDFTRSTGIDDGELVPVLDLKIKQNMLDGWKGRITAGGGSRDRYDARVNANKFTKKEQQTMLANINDLPSKMSFNNATRTQLGGGSVGEIRRREAGYTFAGDFPGLDIDGSARYQGRDNDVYPVGQQQNIQGSGTSFVNADNHSVRSQDGGKVDMKIEWKPDKKTTFIAKPVISFDSGTSWSSNNITNFKTDPSNPTSWGFNNQDSYNDKTTGSIYLQFTRKFGKRGRSLSVSTSESFNINGSIQGTDYLTRYNRTKQPTEVLRRQLIDNVNRNYTVMGQLAWNEPLSKGFYFQFILRGDIKQNNNVRSVYDILSVDPDWVVGNWHSRSRLLSSLPEGYESSLMDDISSKGRYSYRGLSVSANLRFVKKKYNLTVGAKVNPQESVLSSPSMEKDVVKGVTYFSPNLTFNYRPDKRKKLALYYRASAGQPSLYSLLPVNNGTNPLYVHIGNPELKPSNTHTFNLSYNASDFRRQNSIVLSLTAKAVENQASNSTIYDYDTGGRTTIPKNINGNWNMNGTLVYNKAFAGTDLSVVEKLSSQYNNIVSYLYNNSLRKDETNRIGRTMIKESFALQYRTSRVDVTLGVGGEYTMERSLLRPDMNQNPWSVSASVQNVIFAPWDIRITADFATIVQRGFVYGDLNDEYYILGAGISRAFLRKRLTVRIEGNDLLGQLPNVTRSFSSQSRSIYTYNGVNSYVILRLIWKFNHSQGNSK